jgi:hypothetical protein
MFRLLTIRCRKCSHVVQGKYDYPIFPKRFKCTRCGGDGAVIKNDPPGGPKEPKKALPAAPLNKPKSTPAPGHCAHCWDEIAPEKPAVKNGLLYHVRCLGELFPTPKKKTPETWNSYKGKTSWKDHK